jgi:hypothetical protein
MQKDMNTLSRRKFPGTSAAALAATALVGPLAASCKPSVAAPEFTSNIVLFILTSLLTGG